MFLGSARRCGGGAWNSARRPARSSSGRDGGVSGASAGSSAGIWCSV